MKYFKTLVYKILKFFGYSLLKIEKEDQKLFFEYFPKNVVHNIKNKDTFYKVFAELDEDFLLHWPSRRMLTCNARRIA